MSAPPIYIFSVHGSKNNNSFHIDAIIMTPEKNEPIETWPLVDSGAGGTFMDQNYTRKQGFNLMKLEYLITAWNVDGTENKQGTIWYYMDLGLHINGKKHGTISYYWIKKPKSHFGITLAAKAQSRN
jgi:hypothetical protein